MAGAVAARLRVYDSGICFVCSHLSSGENEGDELKRNYDYSEIVRRGQFPPDSAVLDPETVLPGSASAESTPQVRLAISLLGWDVMTHHVHPCCHASMCHKLPLTAHRISTDTSLE